MDRLQKQREEFQRGIERNIARPSSDSNLTRLDRKPAKKKQTTSTTQNAANDSLKNLKSLPNFDYSTGKVDTTAGPSHSVTAGSNQYFAAMARIVDYMKKRHLENQHWYLSLHDCLDEMRSGPLDKKTEAWLREILPQNPRLQFEGDKFAFKPPYKIKSDAQIIAQLQKHYRDSKGAILLSELNECFAKAEERMEKLAPQVVIIPCLVGKKKDKAYFFNDPEVGITVEEDFKTLWRTSHVQSLDEKQIDEYLTKHGLSIIKEQGIKRLNHGPGKRKQQRRRPTTKLQNTHMEGILEEYMTGD